MGVSHRRTDAPARFPPSPGSSSGSSGRRHIHAVPSFSDLTLSASLARLTVAQEWPASSASFSTFLVATGPPARVSRRKSMASAMAERSSVLGLDRAMSPDDTSVSMPWNSTAATSGLLGAETTLYFMVSGGSDRLLLYPTKKFMLSSLGRT